VCTINGCNFPWVNVDGVYSNGCECQDLQVGENCSTGTFYGTIGVGGSDSRTGNLPSPSEENWWIIAFAYTNQPNYHPHLNLTSAPGTAMVMDVYSSCGLGAAGFGCNSGGDVANTTGLLSWDVFGGGDPTNKSSTYSATPSVGTVYVRIRQIGGARTCAQYTLSISN
jgi:hypothetical protein